MPWGGGACRAGSREHIYIYIRDAGWIIISRQQHLKPLEPIQLLAHSSCYRRREKFSDSRGFDTDRMAGDLGDHDSQGSIRIQPTEVI